MTEPTDEQVHAALSTYLDVHRNWAEWEKWQIESMRAALLAAAPTWEYGTALRTPNGSLWDFEYEGTREAAEWHVRACAKDGHDHGMDECVIVRRSPRISVGEWVPVKQEGAGHEGDS